MSEPRFSRACPGGDGTLLTTTERIGLFGAILVLLAAGVVTAAVRNLDDSDTTRAEGPPATTTTVTTGSTAAPTTRVTIAPSTVPDRSLAPEAGATPTTRAAAPTTTTGRVATTTTLSAATTTTTTPEFADTGESFLLKGLLLISLGMFGLGAARNARAGGRLRAARADLDRPGPRDGRAR